MIAQSRAVPASLRTTELGLALFVWEEQQELCFTVFRDGTIARSYPEPGQRSLAADLGYEQSRAGVVLMNRHHEYLHSLLAARQGQGVSDALWAVAHGLDTDTDTIRFEEDRVLSAQRRLMMAVNDPDLWPGLPGYLKYAWLECRDTSSPFMELAGLRMCSHAVG